MNRTVMIVEDDREIRISLKDILEDEGYNVLSASNGQEALEMLYTADSLPCFIILDLMMPVLDGIGFRKVQAINSQLSMIPTAIVSADGQLTKKAELAGVNDFIKKPINLDELFALVKKYCDC
jgi:DNA-binding response OmpR family regulator